jgi:hypothetical protein
MNENPTSWIAVRNGVASGEFRVDADTGNLLQSALQHHLHTLEDALLASRQATRAAGFGAFPHSGQAMEGKYTAKATDAPDSLKNRIQEHITQVTLMMNDIKKMMGDFTETDESNRRSIQGAMPS